MPKANGPNHSDQERLKRSQDRMNSPPAQFKDAGHEASEIPQFDLAEQIMAEQRKVAATRRKGPAKRVDAAKQEKSEPMAPSVEMFRPPSEEEEVIAEIVARDIQQLCRPSGWSVESGIGGKK